MNKIRYTIIFAILFISNIFSQGMQNHAELKKDFIQLSGELFRDVQLAGIFPDSKTFVDAVPIVSPDSIKRIYASTKSQPDFNLAQFVYAYFKIPEVSDSVDVPESASMDEHIETLWDNLVRKPGAADKYSTLIPLKKDYIVPGGRFREIYYWDSFFTILGLLADGKVTIAENMITNFSALLEQYGMIPNGNRVYYLTRSQPPFFAMMVDIVCRYKKDFKWGLQFLPALEKEYAFWMHGLNNNTSGASERVVKISAGILNRYYDYDTIPREESYKEDYLLAQKQPEQNRTAFYRNVRAAAESGWDFSSRWFADGENLSTIITTDILPVDLNCLLWFLEDRLSYFNNLNGNSEKSSLYKERASARRNLINSVFWNEEEKFYFDYNWKTEQHTKVYSLAGCYPLYFGIADEAKAKAVSNKIKEFFLMPGGLITTKTNTHQQWDSPNGWAPLQWMTIKGLREYGSSSLADDIKIRWLRINENVFLKTGKMTEKYNVIDITLAGGGGEYPNQDGFGWTNGVAAALLADFDKMYLARQPEQ